MAVVDSGQVVAGASVVFPVRDNLPHAFAMLAVRPPNRRQGIGSRLVDRIVDEARAQGRRTLQMHVSAPAGTEPAGFAFAQRHGFTLGQRLLRGDLDVTLATMTGEAAAGAGAHPAYRIEQFTGLPEAREADYARFQEAMTIDIPLGDLALEPEVWDVDRVRAQSERTAAMGRTRWIAFAVHEGSGECVGFTEIQWGPGMGDRAVHRPARRQGAAAVRAGDPGLPHRHRREHRRHPSHARGALRPHARVSAGGERTAYPDRHDAPR